MAYLPRIVDTELASFLTSSEAAVNEYLSLMPISRVGKPVDGPPRWYSVTTSGTSLLPAQPRPSAISAKPGPEVAVALNVSLATAERWWLYSRSWLYAELSGEKKTDSE